MHNELTPEEIALLTGAYHQFIEVITRTRDIACEDEEQNRINALIGKLGRNDVKIRDELSQIGKLAIPALIQALECKDSGVRSGAAFVLGNIAGAGKIAKEAVPILVKLSKDENASVNAVNALSKIGHGLSKIGELPEEIVPALIEALKDKDAGVRNNAAGGLGGMGELAKEAVPALMEALRDEVPYVRDAAALALRGIGDARAVPALVEALDNEYDGEVREWIAHALVGIGELAVPPEVFRRASNIIERPDETQHLIATPENWWATH